MKTCLAIASALAILLALANPVGSIGPGGGHLSAMPDSAYYHRTAHDSVAVADSAKAIKDRAVTARGIALGSLTPELFTYPFGITGGDSVTFSVPLRFWSGSKIDVASFDTWWIAMKTDALHSGLFLTSAAGGLTGNGMLRVNANEGHTMISDADAGQPSATFYNDYQTGGRGIYARLGAHTVDDRGAAGYFECADTTHAHTSAAAIYGKVDNATYQYGLYIENGKVFLPAGCLAYSVLSTAAQDSMHTHAAKADSAGKVAASFKPTTAVLADTSKTLRIGAVLPGAVNAAGGVYITGTSGTNFYVGDSVTVTLPDRAIGYDNLTSAAQDSMHTWAYDAELAMYCYLALGAQTSDSAVVAAYAYDAAACDYAPLAFFADSAAQSRAALYANTAGSASYADSAGAVPASFKPSTAVLADTTKAVRAHAVGWAGLSTAVQDSIQLVPPRAVRSDSALVAASAHLASNATHAAYADTAAKAGWAAIGADTVGYADTSLVAATAYALKPLGLGWAAFSAACKDSLKTRVHPDSSLKAAKADSAGKVATTFKPTTAVLADTSIAVRGNAVGHATTADSSGKVATTFKPTTATLSDSTKKVGDGSIGTTQLAHLNGRIYVEPTPVGSKWAAADVVPTKGRLAFMASHGSPDDSCLFGMQLTADPDSAHEPARIINLIWKDSHWHSRVTDWPIAALFRTQIDTNSTVIEAKVENVGPGHTHYAVNATSGLDDAQTICLFGNADGLDSTKAFAAYGGVSVFSSTHLRITNSPTVADAASPITANGKITTNDTLRANGPIVLADTLYRGVTAEYMNGSGGSQADSIVILTTAITSTDTLGVTVMVTGFPYYPRPTCRAGATPSNSYRVAPCFKLYTGASKGFVLTRPALAVGDTVRYYWEIKRLR